MKKNVYQKPAIMQYKMESNICMVQGSLGSSDKPASGTITPLSVDEEEEEVVLPNSCRFSVW